MPKPEPSTAVMLATVPAHEDRRLEVLSRYRILDTPPEPVFDELVALAASFCQTPLGLITFADRDRIWVKARVGTTVSELPRETWWCSRALHESDLLVIPDATAAGHESHRLLEPDHEPIRFYAAAPLVTPDGTPLGTLCVMDRRRRDLTGEQRTALRVLARQVVAHLELRRQAADYAQSLQDRRQAEQTIQQRDEQLRQAQKMEAIGNLAGGVAHDFNNLLTVITGYSELALKKVAPTDPLHRRLEEIKKAGDRAAALTQQLLAFSRRQILLPKIVDLNAVISGMGSMLQRLVGEDVHVNIALAPNLGRIKADPNQLEQVIMNLAVNARDAMPQGGKLTIETVNVDRKPVYASLPPGVAHAPYVMLGVTDTGCGMDAATQARVFEPYFTTKEQGKGTGLGLSTVYGIVKQSGGEILLYSEPGHGTTFKIYLPREDAAVLDAPPVRFLDSLPRGTETVLLVEDEPGVRAFAGEALRTHGYTILEAKHGIEALVMSAQHREPIHLLLTDVVMPQMNGREVAEKLLPQRPSLKVLYMSGYAEQAVMHRGGIEGGFAFLQKPFTEQALVCKVRDVLDAMAVLNQT